MKERAGVAAVAYLPARGAAAATRGALAQRPVAAQPGLHGPGDGLGTGPESSPIRGRRGGSALRHQEEPQLLEWDFQMLPWPQTLGVGTLYINTVTRRWMAAAECTKRGPRPTARAISNTGTRNRRGLGASARAMRSRPRTALGTRKGGTSTRTAGSGAGARDPGGVFLGVIINAY